MDRSVVRHRSKVDWWLAILIVSVPVVALVSALALQLTGETAEAILGWTVMAGVIGLYVAVVWPVEYELQPEELVIRFGLVRSRIAYRSIRRVRPSRSVLASPALSLDRLAIETGLRLPVTISPADRSRFLDDLVTRTPQLVRLGDQLVTR